MKVLHNRLTTKAKHIITINNKLNLNKVGQSLHKIKVKTNKNTNKVSSVDSKTGKIISHPNNNAKNNKSSINLKNTDDQDNFLQLTISKENLIISRDDQNGRERVTVPLSESKTSLKKIHSMSNHSLSLSFIDKSIDEHFYFCNINNYDKQEDIMYY
jgi:hypothetical protein